MSWETLPFDLEDIPELTHEQRDAAIEEARYKMMIDSVLWAWNITQAEVEMRRRAIDTLNSAWLSSYVIESLFRFWVSATSILKFTEDDIQYVMRAYETLKSKTHEVYPNNGPYRRRHIIEQWAFEEFRATLEALEWKFSWSHN